MQEAETELQQVADFTHKKITSVKTVALLVYTTSFCPMIVYVSSSQVKFWGRKKYSSWFMMVE